jgi:hypothetical protein
MPRKKPKNPTTARGRWSNLDRDEQYKVIGELRWMARDIREAHITLPPMDNSKRALTRAVNEMQRKTESSYLLGAEALEELGKL